MMTSEQALALAVTLQGMDKYEAAKQLIYLEFEAEKRGANETLEIYKTMKTEQLAQA